MYNWSYINSFRANYPSDKRYREILENPKLLNMLEKEYLAKYSEDADVFYLALKESLDHYVAMRIAQDKRFIETEDFKNYAQYLKRLVQQNKEKYMGTALYIEPNINIVFNYLDEQTLNKIYPNNALKSHREYNQRIYDRIFRKLEENAIVTSEELSLVSIYLDNVKDFKSGKYETYINYIFSHLDSIKPTPAIVSAILSFLPHYYKEGTENARTFIGGKDRGNPINWAHSMGLYGYTCFDYNIINSIKLNSSASANSSRTYQEKDLIFLLFVENHELSHQRQGVQTKNEESFEGAAYELNLMLRSTFNDYGRNHDSDEIEIDADERGWKKTRQFLSKYYKGKDKQELMTKCFKNAQAVNCRRSFSVKIDPTTQRLYRYIDYDIKRLLEAIKINPESLQQYPHLAAMLTTSGQINIDYLFNNVITPTPAGREFCNFILNNIPEQVAIAAINSGKYTARQVNNLIENLVQVPHYNALTMRDLKKTDLNTFNETCSRCNIKESLNGVYNRYFIECSQQLMKFSTILEAARKRYDYFDQSYVDSLYNFFIGYYYVEMLENIERPNMELINKQMMRYQQSDNKVLTYLAKYTISYLNRKNSNNKNQINQGFSQESSIPHINSQLSDMLMNSERNIGRMEENTSVKKVG